MPRISEMINSNYLKKEDIEDEVIVTIVGVKKANIAREDQDADYKWLMKFDEFEKPMVLNSTNIQLLARACGSENTDDWKDCQVVLYVDDNVSFGGKLVGGLRIKALKKQKAAVNAQAPTGRALPSDGSSPVNEDDLGW
jgi:hypothetical protein